MASLPPHLTPERLLVDREAGRREIDGGGLKLGFELGRAALGLKIWRKEVRGGGGSGFKGGDEPRLARRETEADRGCGWGIRLGFEFGR